MTLEKGRYFLAIIPPSPLLEKADQLKHYFKDHYNSKASLNSPPHITLHMPFEWRNDREDRLAERLGKFCEQQSTVRITFNDFDCFEPRVIFVNVINTPDLIDLQNSIRLFCKKELGLFNADYKDLPFHPHLTLAFRDLKKQIFPRAWEEFRSKKFDGEFTCNEVSLLKHVDGKWTLLKNLFLCQR